MSQTTSTLTPPEQQSATGKTFTAKAFSAKSATSPLAQATIQRRAPRPQDIQIEILYCGVCHSDLHQARNEWESMMPTVYPCVPGHEIVGRVVKAGSAVKKFKEGDIAAVGCMVDSDRTCPNCRAGNEQFWTAQPHSPTIRETSTWAASPTEVIPTALSLTRPSRSTCPVS
ncbi:MAG: alcohol dehydrogenase catalytic domain-containing protein [Terriglobales bacterium]